MASDTSTPADLFCTGYRLRKATRRATQIYDHLLAEHDLTLTQYGLIAMLARDGAVSLSTLAERAGMDRTSMTRTIRPLVREGHVEMAPSDEDGRVKLVRLTSQGQQTFEKALSSWQTAQRHLGRSLGRDKLALLHELLSDVAALDGPDQSG